MLDLAPRGETSPADLASVFDDVHTCCSLRTGCGAAKYRPVYELQEEPTAFLTDERCDDAKLFEVMSGVQRLLHMLDTVQHTNELNT